MCVQYNLLSFGYNIEKLTQDKGLTEDEVRAKTGIEDLDTVPDVEGLSKLCNLFNCDIDTLLN